MKIAKSYLLKSINIKILLFAVLLSFVNNSFSQDPNFYIFLCFGQSNMEGNATTIAASYKTNVDTRFRVMEALNCSNLGRTQGNWYTATPPLCRCYTGLTPVDNFGRTMVANLPSNIKVGVINVAVGGCKIELFDKDTYVSYLSTAATWLQNYANDYGGNPYGRLVEIAKLAQKDGVIKGILLHQGESNNGDTQWPSKVKKIYNDLMTDLSLDATKVPLLAGEVVNADQGGTCAGMNSTIATLPNTLPNSYVISSAGCTDTTDNLHFNVAGYWEIGRRYAMKMLSLLGPTVSITSPVANANFTSPASITINASASTNSGSVSKVEFYNGNTKIGVDATAPYSFTWTNVAAGTYSLTAVVTDNASKTATSAAVTVKVNAAQGPYGGTPWPIPGKIEFENYDEGGNGFAYNDGTAGSATSVAFRTNEDVDIENCTDVGTGYNIGYATNGEWLEYTVNVVKAGKYDLTLRAACNGDGRTVSVSAKDIVVAKDIAIPNTAGWQTWSDVKVQGISLDAGTQVIRVTIGSTDYVNLNYMTFASQSQPLPTISLKSGWNMIGCPLEGSTDIATAFSSMCDNVITIKDVNSFYDKSQSTTFNSLSKIEWGKGYWIKVKQQCVLNWPTK